MIALKYKEIQKWPADELEKKLYDLKTELMKLNAQVAIGTTPKSTKQIREIKRNLARVETLKKDNYTKAVKNLKTAVKDVKLKRYKRL